ncbi:GIY-YIG nuclease family protein [Acinetobacter sp. ANC 3791]|uniref:GIY-YIG nuclease family protein n=1 Tax=Acinetobacter sp. ANC 3791 TaxID=2529836 RepID=UPI00103BA003|nr:GIY-YIG nuclease family protein [Acinetobacter sp. ANC 3791]TCB85934.1 GIY-YIG nuclease family protein [Acinetobacter sp. ANC 3791]
MPYYVYEFRDPQDNSVIYVSKGTGQRMLRSFELDKAQLNSIEAKVKAIQDAGYTLQRVVVGRFSTEEEAFAVEATLIKWVYGFERLNNQIHRHHHQNIRDYTQHLHANYSEISGIDIPRKIKLANDRSGQFSDEQRRKIAENLIIGKLNSLYSELCHAPELAHLQIDLPDLSVPQDPQIRIQFGNAIVQLSIKMQLTGKDMILNLVPIEKPKQQRQQFSTLVMEHLTQPFSPKNDGHYAPTFDQHTKGIQIEVLSTMTPQL